MSHPANHGTGSSEIADRLADIGARIRAVEAAAGRPAGSVTLVAVSKSHPAAAAEQALLAGHRVFGENRVQEAQQKWPDLRTRFPDARLHLIGPLQTNKARDAVALFDVIHTLDRPKLAESLAREMERLGRRPDLLIQVNTGEEPQKAGVAPSETEGFVNYCRNEMKLPVVGLMCIPPVGDNPAIHFAFLAEMAARLGLAELSMGMTADFEVAIRFGATLVRVGTAIFGERQSRDA